MSVRGLLDGDLIPIITLIAVAVAFVVLVALRRSITRRPSGPEGHSSPGRTWTDHDVQTGGADRIGPSDPGYAMLMEVLTTGKPMMGHRNDDGTWDVQLIDRDDLDAQDSDR